MIEVIPSCLGRLGKPFIHFILVDEFLDARRSWMRLTCAVTSAFTRSIPSAGMWKGPVAQQPFSVIFRFGEQFVSSVRSIERVINQATRSYARSSRHRGTRHQSHQAPLLISCLLLLRRRTGRGAWPRRFADGQVA